MGRVFSFQYMRDELKAFFLDKRISKVFVWTFVFSLLAHGFRWFNAGFCHDSLMVVDYMRLWNISIGRYLIPFYLLIRGRIAAPVLIAFFAVCFLSLANIFIVKTLDIKKPLYICILCGLLATCSTITNLYATFVYCTDVYMLSLLLAVYLRDLTCHYGSLWFDNVYLLFFLTKIAQSNAHEKKKQ